MQVLKFGLKVGGSVFLVVLALLTASVATGHGTTDGRQMTYAEAALAALGIGFSSFLFAVVLGSQTSNDK